MKPKVKKNSDPSPLNSKKVSNNWINFVKSQSKVPVFHVNKANSNKMVTVKNKPKETKVVALDCEMVSNEKGEDMLARVSVVDFSLNTIYDKYVKPTSPVADYRTRFSGIRPSDIENGTEFDIVKKEVQELLRNKFLVGHALVHDLKALQFGHHAKLIRDTSLYKPFREVSDGKTPGLKKLTQTFLNEIIQQGEHSSVEDACAAMKLYKKFRHEWEKSIFNRSANTSSR